MQHDSSYDPDSLKEGFDEEDPEECTILNFDECMDHKLPFDPYVDDKGHKTKTFKVWKNWFDDTTEHDSDLILDDITVDEIMEATRSIYILHSQ